MGKPNRVEVGDIRKVYLHEACVLTTSAKRNFFQFHPRQYVWLRELEFLRSWTGDPQPISSPAKHSVLGSVGKRSIRYICQCGVCVSSMPFASYTDRMSGPKPTEQQLERIASPDPDVVPNKHTAVDEELRRYVVAADSVEVDEATSKRLRRLIDKRVLIVMVGTYFLQSLDKNAISFAAIMGIQEDAHLVGQDVSLTPMLEVQDLTSTSIPGFTQSSTLAFFSLSIRPTS